MNILAKILLLLFLSFLSTPTIVTLIEKKSDISSLYSFSEEEIQKDIKINDFLGHECNYIFEIFPQLINININIISENLSKHDSILEEIFSPPPELI
jgi:hypothetical protein